MAAWLDSRTGDADHMVSQPPALRQLGYSAMAARDQAAAIRSAYETWFSAIEAGDIERALSAVTADVVHQGPAGAARVGRDALRAALAKFHASYTERVEWTLEIIDVSYDDAEVRVHETATVHPRAGGPDLVVRGRHHGRLRRDTDGTWRIALDVTSLDGPPEPAEER